MIASFLRRDYDYPHGVGVLESTNTQKEFQNEIGKFII
jgi:hypothetical protein